MISFEFTDTINNIDFKLISHNTNDILYFDLETTGLSADHSDLYIIGLSYIHDETLKTVLLFNDDGNSETEMLLSFNTYLAGKKYLVSYNGDTFDIPYLTSKYNANGLDASAFKNLCSIDIYRRIRSYKKYLHLDSMKQKDIEQLMGIKRSSFISGGELIAQYKSYLINGDKNLLDNLITHNHDDLTGLTGITNSLSIYNLFHGIYKVASACLENNTLKISLSDINLPFRINYATEELTINGLADNIIITIPVMSGELKYFFSDYRNYYYLPAEDMAIHKSMAEYVDRGYKQKATKDTAYIKKNTAFIRQGTFQTDYIYKKDTSSKICYVELTQQLLNDNELLQTYVSGILK